MKTYSYQLFVLTGKVGELEKHLTRVGQEGFRLRETVPGSVTIGDGQRVEQHPVLILEREEP